jgi:hypothetical protein
VLVSLVRSKHQSVPHKQSVPNVLKALIPLTRLRQLAILVLNMQTARGVMYWMFKTGIGDNVQLAMRLNSVRRQTLVVVALMSSLNVVKAMRVHFVMFVLMDIFEVVVIAVCHAVKGPPTLK